MAPPSAQSLPSDAQGTSTKLQTTRRSTRKRSRVGDPLNEETSQPRKKRASQKKSSHLSLMQLPTEVRLQILQELLWQAKPLRIETYINWEDRDRIQMTRFEPKASFRFCPAILRVCRQLHEEGEPMLYENTFACDIWFDDNGNPSEGHHSSLLKCGWDVWENPPRKDRASSLPVPPCLTKNIKRLDLSIHVPGIWWMLDMRAAVRNFVKGFERLKQVVQLDVNVQSDMDEDETQEVFDDVSGEDVMVSKQELLDLAAGPLALMRCLQSVRFNGVSEKVARELASAMTQKTCAIDLPRMSDALSDYTLKEVSPTHCTCCAKKYNYLDLADQAVDLGDLEMFKTIREIVLAMLHKHQARKRGEVWRFDPPDDNWLTFDKYENPVLEDMRSCNDESVCNDEEFTNYDESVSDDEESSYWESFWDDEEPEWYVNVETMPIQEAREAREEQDPTLKTLWRMWDVRQNDNW